MVNKYHKIAAKVISHSRKLSIPGLAGAAVGLVVKGHYAKKAAKIKAGGIVTKKTKAQIAKNKKIVAKRKYKAAFAKKKSQLDKEVGARRAKKLRARSI